MEGIRLRRSAVQKYGKREIRHRDVYKDLHDVYKITNLAWNVEGVGHYFTEQFYKDYEYHMANYKAYIQPGMDARMLMEIRKSMVLGFEDKIYYEAFDGCKTANDVIEARKAILNRYNAGYMDIPWQYYLLVKCSRGNKITEYFVFDFESCYLDGDASKQTSVGQYADDFAKDFMRSVPICSCVGGHIVTMGDDGQIYDLGEVSLDDFE